MKIWRGVLLLALLHSIVVLAHNNYHNNTDRHVKKKKPNSILHKLWKRDVNCPGEYSTKTHCCKLCDAGTFAESDCAENHGRPNCRNCLEGSNYMDEQNGYHECHKCWHCDKELGQEVLRACNMRQNTVCRCAENFFCTGNGTVEDGGCRACKHCTKCEFKQAEPCTATKDTVCKSQRYHRILIVPFVSIPLLLLLLLVLYGVRGKRGTASTGNSPHPVVSPSHLPEELKDMDLNALLSDFSEMMDLSTAQTVVRSMGVPDTTIDGILNDYRAQTNEQKYQLLKTWYGSRGRTGAFQQLINTLRKYKKIQLADQLEEIARSHLQQSQG